MLIAVLELCDYDINVLRERRRLHFTQRFQCPYAHVNVGVRKHRDQGVGVLRQRRRPELAQRLQCRLAHVGKGVLKHRDHGVGREGRRLQLS